MNEKSKGRPKGKNKDDRLHIMISSSTKQEFQQIVKNDGSNISVKICELISEYIKKSKMEKKKIEKRGN